MQDNRTLSRRDFVATALGLLPGLALAGRAAPSSDGRIRSGILLFSHGGPSHLDTLGPKPAAPAEVRGEYRSTATARPRHPVHRASASSGRRTR